MHKDLKEVRNQVRYIYWGRAFQEKMSKEAYVVKLD